MPKKLVKTLYDKNYRKEEIDCLINNFDFDKVHKIMTFLNWEWRGEGIPSTRQLKTCARKLLVEAALEIHEKDWNISTGGFTVRKIDNDYLSLSFELDQVDSTWYRDFD